MLALTDHVTLTKPGERSTALKAQNADSIVLSCCCAQLQLRTSDPQTSLVTKSCGTLGCRTGCDLAEPGLCPVMQQL